MNTTVNWQPSDLKNELVSLTPLKHSDFEALYKIASDPLIWEQHPIFDRFKKEVFKTYFNFAMESKSAFLLHKADTQEIIGSSRFYEYSPKNKTVAIGYTFLPRKYWGTAINRSLKTLLINYAFAQDIEAVIFYAGAANLRSQKAIEKLGAVRTREFLKEDEGRKIHKIEFAIKKEDWINNHRNDAF